MRLHKLTLVIAVTVFCSLASSAEESQISIGKNTQQHITSRLYRAMVTSADTAVDIMTKVRSESNSGNLTTHEGVCADASPAIKLMRLTGELFSTFSHSFEVQNPFPETFLNEDKMGKLLFSVSIAESYGGKLEAVCRSFEKFPHVREFLIKVLSKTIEEAEVAAKNTSLMLK